MPLRFFNDGQEVVFEDYNKITTAIQREIYDRMAYEMLQRTTNAFFDDSFKVQFASATAVTVLKGLGFQQDLSQATPEPTYRPVYVASDANIAIAAADASDDRIDLIVVKNQVVDEVTELRKFKDAISEIISDQSLVVQKDWDAEILVVQGTPDASPVAPAVPSGYIKLAEVVVSAVTGVAGAGAITDFRTILPVGGDLSLNTLGYARLTASASIPLSTLLSEIDGYLTAGLQDYTDIIENNSPDAEVSDPSIGRQRLFYRDGVLFIKDSTGAKVPVGSGGGGGGGLVWSAPDGQAPISDEENLQDVYLFQSGLSQKLVVYLKVPDSYLSGRQINMGISLYSPSSADTILLNATIGLIRAETDPIDTPFQTRNSTNTALTNTVANQARNTLIDLTTPTGLVNGAAVQAGDILKIELKRGGDTDLADIRFIPTSTEVVVG